MKNKGFTLTELLVTIAIIGIVASAGIVAYTGIIAGVKKEQAAIGLQSIYSAQLEYEEYNKIFFQSNRNCHFHNDDSAVINTNLFSGEKILENDNYNFCIEYLNGPKTFQANAYTKDGSAVYFTIRHTNHKKMFDGKSWQNGW